MIRDIITGMAITIALMMPLPLVIVLHIVGFAPTLSKIPDTSMVYIGLTVMEIVGIILLVTWNDSAKKKSKAQ